MNEAAPSETAVLATDALQSSQLHQPTTAADYSAVVKPEEVVSHERQCAMKIIPGTPLPPHVDEAPQKHSVAPAADRNIEVALPPTASTPVVFTPDRSTPVKVATIQDSPQAALDMPLDSAGASSPEPSLVLDVRSLQDYLNEVAVQAALVHDCSLSSQPQALGEPTGPWAESSRMVAIAKRHIVEAGYALAAAERLVTTAAGQGDGQAPHAEALLMEEEKVGNMKLAGTSSELDLTTATGRPRREAGQRASLALAIQAQAQLPDGPSTHASRDDSHLDSKLGDRRGSWEWKESSLEGALNGMLALAAAAAELGEQPGYKGRIARRASGDTEAGGNSKSTAVAAIRARTMMKRSNLTVQVPSSGDGLGLITPLTFSSRTAGSSPLYSSSTSGCGLEGIGRGQRACPACLKGIACASKACKHCGHVFRTSKRMRTGQPSPLGRVPYDHYDDDDDQDSLPDLLHNVHKARRGEAHNKDDDEDEDDEDNQQGRERSEDDETEDEEEEDGKQEPRRGMPLATLRKQRVMQREMAALKAKLAVARAGGEAGASPAGPRSIAEDAARPSSGAGGGSGPSTPNSSGAVKRPRGAHGHARLWKARQAREQEVPEGHAGSLPVDLKVADSLYEPGTIKHACYSLLAVVGARGLTAGAIVERTRLEGYHDWGSAKTPENSVVAALSQDDRFVRVAPSTYALRAAAEAEGLHIPSPSPRTSTHGGSCRRRDQEGSKEEKAKSKKRPPEVTIPGGSASTYRRGGEAHLTSPSSVRGPPSTKTRDKGKSPALAGAGKGDTFSFGCAVSMRPRMKHSLKEEEGVDEPTAQDGAMSNGAAEASVKEWVEGKAEGAAGGGKRKVGEPSFRSGGAEGDLESLTLKELQAAFASAFGRRTTSKNKSWMRGKLEEKGVAMGDVHTVRKESGLAASPRPTSGAAGIPKAEAQPKAEVKHEAAAAGSKPRVVAAGQPEPWLELVPKPPVQPAAKAAEAEVPRKRVGEPQEASGEKTRSGGRSSSSNEETSVGEQEPRAMPMKLKLKEKAKEEQRQGRLHKERDSEKESGSEKERRSNKERGKEMSEERQEELERRRQLKRQRKEQLMREHREMQAAQLQRFQEAHEAHKRQCESKEKAARSNEETGGSGKSSGDFDDSQVQSKNGKQSNGQRSTEMDQCHGQEENKYVDGPSGSSTSQEERRSTKSLDTRKQLEDLGGGQKRLESASGSDAEGQEGKQSPPWHRIKYG